MNTKGHENRIHSAIAPTTSALLDVLRITAALVVFFQHLSASWFLPKLGIGAEAGHDAVTVFFVLSGYLIAYSIEGHRRKTGRQYVLARLSRLYSVLLPSLVLTMLLLKVGNISNPEFYQQFHRGFDGLRLFIAAGFLQEVWFIGNSPRTNPVLWSLSYEFWYYVFFGIWTYARHRAIGKWILFGALIFAGPKILLLLPIWCMGAGAFAFGKRINMHPHVAFASLFSTLMLVVLLLWTNWRSPCALGIAPLYHSGWFLSDYVMGLAVSLMIVFADQAFQKCSFPTSVLRIPKFAADISFSLYLFHYPLLVFATAVIPFDHGSGFQGLSVAAGVLIVVIMLSWFTESRRGVVHEWLEKITSRIFGPPRILNPNAPTASSSK